MYNGGGDERELIEKVVSKKEGGKVTYHNHFLNIVIILGCASIFRRTLDCPSLHKFNWYKASEIALFNLETP